MNRLSPRATVLNDYLTKADSSETLGDIANDLVLAIARQEITDSEAFIVASNYAEAAARVAVSEAA
jgi:hypothetical protein